MAEAVERIVNAVHDFGGTVKDLAGDGVLALFGAPIAHEDDTERAVRTGLRIAADIAAYAGEIEAGWGVEGFAVRIGIESGPVILGPLGAGERVEYAAFGDTVNTAARLQAAAEPQTVLVGATARRVVEQQFEWEPSRRLELKGKSSPVEASVAARALADAPRHGGTSAAVVGRERELEQARVSLQAVSHGAGGILLLSGEPGIGKSRLITELRGHDPAAAERGPALWLEGRCVSYGDSMPYWPFRDLLRRWLGVTLDEPELRVRLALRRALDRLFGERTPELYPYLGSLLDLSLEADAKARLAELSPEALQYRTFEVVGQLLARLAAEQPTVVALEDLHWADATSLQLVESLLALADEAAVLLVLTLRRERGHASWRVRDVALDEYPHRAVELALEPLPAVDGARLLDELARGAALPAELQERLMIASEGNPFFLEELVGSLVDAGALRAEDDGYAFDHDVPVELPPTVEQVVVARIDRLEPAHREVLISASALGRQFGLPLLEGIVARPDELQPALRELQRADLLREERRWPQPEYRFKHALIQEGAYRTMLASQRTASHRRAAEWLEGRYAGREEEAYGLLAHHWLAARDEDKAITYLTRAGDKARQEYALDEAVEHYRALLPLLEEHGREQEGALVLFKLALALHTSLRFAEANAVYQRAFEHWRPPPPFPGEQSATLRLGTSFLPNDPDPHSAIAWPNIQLCMQLFDRLVEAWPERTLVPALAERWEIADDGLRYTFHLREGLRWSDGAALTAHDVEYGIKRVLDPAAAGASVSIYFALEHGLETYLGQNRDFDRVGVRALDDRTVEFRLAAPAPYFMSVMNRPDGGPQPRHAIEAHGADWTEPELQVVSGPFRQSERSPERLVLSGRDDYTSPRRGNLGRIELVRSPIGEAIEQYRKDELDLVVVRYTPKVADIAPETLDTASLGPAAWTGYLTFDHTSGPTSNVELRRALAHAVDRETLAQRLGPNLMVATGGLVPPALQGHTPEIAPRYDPERAREHLAAAGAVGPLRLAAYGDYAPLAESVAEGWRRELGLEVVVEPWTQQEAATLGRPWEQAPIVLTGWLPGYPDPEYFLRLLLQSATKTNEGGFAHPPFDSLIERARQEPDDRSRLELFHEADRMAVADQVALIPLVYGRSMAFVQPRVHGWWEFGKSSAALADLVVD